MREGSPSVKSPVELVLGTTPTDDAGAQTADRFDWQAGMAAADGLRLLLDVLDDNGELPAGTARRVVCEYHEDWVVIIGDDAELVSAKHRELEAGPYTTIKQLVMEGGIGHLFNRWCALDHAAYCRLVTSTALANAAAEFEPICSLLRRKAEGHQPTSDEIGLASKTTGMVASLILGSKHCPEHWMTEGGQEAGTPALSAPEMAAEIEAFLARLTIDHSRPLRQWVEHLSPSAFAKPVLERMITDTTPDSCVAAWEACLGLFRSRMRAAGPRPAGRLPAPLRRLGATSDSDHAAADVAARTITVEDLELTIRAALRSPLAYRPLGSPVNITRLGIKMNQGRCGPNSITRAEHLRTAYNQYWRERRNNVPGSSSEQVRLELTLLRKVDKATEEFNGTRGPWGAQLWSALDESTSALTSGNVPSGFDPELALGGVASLAAKCKVWFSEPFDIKMAIEKAKRERGIQ